MCYNIWIKLITIYFSTIPGKKIELLNINNLVFRQQPLIPQPEKHLSHRNYIPFAILKDPFQVVLFVIHIPDHAPVDIFLGGWDAQDMGE
jgi:hypothetical protein